MSYYKPFDQVLFNLNDKPARKKVYDILSTKYDVRGNTNKYKTDLQVFRKDGSIYAEIEIEVKHVWSGYRFPYDNVQIPGRKTHQFDSKTIIIMFNHDLSHHLAIKASKILEFGIEREVINKYSKGNKETFWAVSLEHFKLDWLYDIVPEKRPVDKDWQNIFRSINEKI